MTTEAQQALIAIHDIVSSDMGLTLEGVEYDHYKLTDNEQKVVARMVGEIYKISHAEVSTCGVHQDWRALKWRHK